MLLAKSRCGRRLNSSIVATLFLLQPCFCWLQPLLSLVKWPCLVVRLPRLLRMIHPSIDGLLQRKIDRKSWFWHFLAPKCKGSSTKIPSSQGIDLRCIPMTSNVIQLYCSLYPFSCLWTYSPIYHPIYIHIANSTTSPDRLRRAWSNPCPSPCGHWSGIFYAHNHHT